MVSLFNIIFRGLCAWSQIRALILDDISMRHNFEHLNICWLRAPGKPRYPPPYFKICALTQAPKHIYIYIYICMICVCINISIYIYIYICNMYVCVYIYIYIYIYMYNMFMYREIDRERERERERDVVICAFLRLRSIEWNFQMPQILFSRSAVIRDRKMALNSPACRRGRDKHIFHRRVTNSIHFAICCFECAQAASFVYRHTDFITYESLTCWYDYP